MFLYLSRHSWFSRGTTFSNVIIVILIVVALNSLSSSSDPGAGSCTYPAVLKSRWGNQG